jgi:hypothetical protein
MATITTSTTGEKRDWLGRKTTPAPRRGGGGGMGVEEQSGPTRRRSSHVERGVRVSEFAIWM